MSLFLQMTKHKFMFTFIIDLEKNLNFTLMYKKYSYPSTVKYFKLLEEWKLIYKTKKGRSKIINFTKKGLSVVETLLKLRTVIEND